MADLTKIGRKYGTDKATYHIFTEFYDLILGQERKNTKKMLEIGIASGNSLRMWREYFPEETIINAIDIVLDGDPKLNNVNCTYGNQDDEKSLLEAFKKFNVDDYDFILEDGGHQISQQRKSLAVAWNFLKSGGFYILEDLHTNIRHWYNGYCDEPITMYENIIMFQEGKKNDLPIDQTTIKYCVLFSRPESTSMTCVFCKK
jgi:predicted O-methyltransferase YrrM